MFYSDFKITGSVHGPSDLANNDDNAGAPNGHANNDARPRPSHR
jgi:hypothetical protein